jgi:DNA-directed RNA polymerase specialized sigma24 family protein
VKTLSAEQQPLVIENLDLVRLSVNAVLAANRRSLTQDEYDDLCGEAARALVESAIRYPAYCAEHGYDPQGSPAEANGRPNEWFRIFATRRMKGSLLDLWRSQSPLTRRETDYSTYAQKHGVPDTAIKYGISQARVREALAHRQATLAQDEVPVSQIADNPQTLWDVLSSEVASLPPICQAWITLVYVHHVPPMQARDMLGFKNRHIPPALALIGYVQFRLVSAVLNQQAA